MIAVAKQSGFTLIELLITTIVIGVLATFVINPVFQQAMGLSERTYRAEQTLINQRLGAALLDYAEKTSSLGTLPAPYTGATDWVSAVLDPADTALEAHLEKSVAGQPVNSDGRDAENVRVYQVVSGLTESLRLYGSTGPAVTVSHEYAVIHTTRCPRASTSTCNSAPIPGDSVELTSLNYTTYEIDTDEVGSYHFSTLPLQQKKLSKTAENLNEILGRMLELKAALEETNAVDGTNYLPISTIATAPDLSGTDPTTNQGCHDGWYNLESADINVLEQLSLNKVEYATTSWGGRIEYCRDYEPAATGSGTGDTAPHFGALRVNRDISSGLAPDSSTPGNNIFVTF